MTELREHAAEHGALFSFAAEDSDAANLPTFGEPYWQQLDDAWVRL